MLLRKKTKENGFKSCLISLLAIVGLLLACFLFCTLVFQLNQAAVPKTSELVTLFFA